MAIEIIKKQFLNQPNYPCQINSEVNCGTYLVQSPVLYVVLEGQITIEYKKKKTTFREGDIFILEDEKTVTYEKKASDVTLGFSSIYIFISQELFVEFRIQFPCLANRCCTSFHLQECYNQVPEVKDIVNKIVVYMQNNGDTEIINHKVQELLYVIRIEMPSLFTHIHLISHIDPPDYVQLVKNNMHMKINQLAGLCKCSCQYFRRKYRQLTNSSPGYDKKKIQMEKIREMVRNTNLSICDIAKKTSYFNVGNLSRAYTRYFHISPSEDRGKSIIS